jgi:homoprotocatechuate degradation regulator HpaR
MRSNASRRVAYRNLPQLFLQGRERLMSHFRPLLNHFGLTEQQWRVLRALDEQGDLEPWALCEACHFHSSSMAGILARMTEMGVIVRQAVPGDQRRVLIGLSARGDRLVREIAPLIDQQYRYIEQALGQRIDELFQALEGFIGADLDAVKKVELPPAAAAPGARKTRRA